MVSLDFPTHLFKSYDIRGVVDADLTDALVALVGTGVIDVTGAKSVVIGEDVRASSKRFADVLSAAVRAAGADVVRLGLCGTEEVYHGVAQHAAGAGIMVTASHNPIEYNGLKIVRAEAKPFSAEEDMPKLKEFCAVRWGDFSVGKAVGEERYFEDKSNYVEKLLSFVDGIKLKPLKVVVNAGNGCAGPAWDALAVQLPFEVVRVHHAPDGNFPNGIPNPILVENRAATADTVVASGADFGVAWDGDFDRCFLFDDKGEFVSNYYLMGILAKALLADEAGGTVVQDIRQQWDTTAVITEAGGQATFSKVGHGHYKKVMRAHNAIMGGEVSGHFYFRDFHFCDSGMVPVLLVAAMLSANGEKLSDVVSARRDLYPSSEEINQPLKGNTQDTLEKIRSYYKDLEAEIDVLDGISVAFSDWRFNVRPSANEPLLRLNLEAKTEALVTAKLAEVQGLIDAL